MEEETFVQRVLPRATPESVAAHTRERVSMLGVLTGVLKGEIAAANTHVKALRATLQSFPRALLTEEVSGTAERAK